MGLIFGTCAKWSHFARIEFVLANLAVLALYLFEDSLLTQYITDRKLHLTVTFHSLQIITITIYFIVSCKNPGIIKPFEDMYEEDMNFNIPSDAEQDNDNVLIGPNKVKPPRAHTKYKYIHISKTIPTENVATNRVYEFTVEDTVPDYNKKILIDAERYSSWPINYCEECNFLRPIRSKHCRICDQCVCKYDHHCPLVSNCVGAFNYKYFVTYLFFQFIILVWTLYICINTLLDVKSGTTDMKVYSHTLFGWVARIIFFVASFVLSFEVIGLLFFHVYLILTGQTTLEFMRPGTIDKYLSQEAKRKRLFERKYRKDVENEMKKDVINEEFINSALSRYQYQYYGNVNSYKSYFNYGLIENIQIVFCERLRREWMTPIKCYFRKIKSGVRYIDELENPISP